MALKKKMTKAEFEKLSEVQRELYVEKDGGYALDLEDEEGDALKRAKDREKELRKAAEAENKELKERLAGLEDGDARKRGDIATLEKSWQGKLADLEKGLTEKLNKKDNYLRSTLIDAKAAELAAKISTSPKLLIPHIKARLVADLDGDIPTTKILDANGQISALNFDDLEKEFVSNPDFGAIIIGSKATGSRAPSQNVNQNRVFGSDKPNLSKMKPEELAATILN